MVFKPRNLTKINIKFSKGAKKIDVELQLLDQEEKRMTKKHITVKDASSQIARLKWNSTRQNDRQMMKVVTG